ncbi:MAG: hypothetical protein Q8O89_09155 [Nanoarchaeota archaeon]|nr:hypothetical protein [Nanoarchaeota archaeon]
MGNEERFLIKSADGRTLTVYDDKVVLSQIGVMGFLSRGLSGNKTIYYQDITSIQFKEAGWTAGFMEFTFPGSNDHTGGPLSGVKNENRFTFSMPTIGAAKALNIKALEAKKFLEEKIREYKNPKQSINSSYSTADELLKLKSLLDSNAINKDEYEKMKASIIKNI